MKKFFALAIVVVALASCKKDYTCECSDSIFTVEIKDAKEADAKEACDAVNELAEAAGESCALK